MKAFVTFSKLREFGAEVNSERLLKEASEKAGKTVFLSHSSADDDLLPGVIRIIEGAGGAVYVDKRDPTLKQLDILEIANRLRAAVRTCRKFVLLVTPRSKDSKWIPWELGLGDGVNGDANVALFPSAEQSYDQQWSEQEYLGIYQRIIWGNFTGEENGQWMVLDHRKNTARKLGEWLRL